MRGAAPSNGGRAAHIFRLTQRGKKLCNKDCGFQFTRCGRISWSRRSETWRHSAGSLLMVLNPARLFDFKDTQTKLLEYFAHYGYTSHNSWHYSS
jgi:hypothetical protein